MSVFEEEVLVPQVSCSMKRVTCYLSHSVLLETLWPSALLGMRSAYKWRGGLHKSITPPLLDGKNRLPISDEFLRPFADITEFSNP